MEAPVGILEVLEEVTRGTADVKKRPTFLDSLDGLCSLAERSLAADEPFESGLGNKLSLEVFELPARRPRVPLEQAVVSAANDLCRTFAADEHFCLILQADDAVNALRPIVHESGDIRSRRGFLREVAGRTRAPKTPSRKRPRSCSQ